MSCKIPCGDLNLFTQYQTFFQIRNRFKRKVFTLLNEGASYETSTWTTSTNTTSGNSPLKKNEVKPPKRNSKIGDSTGASLKKVEIDMPEKKSKIDDGKGGSAPLKKLKRSVNYYYKYFK